MEGVGIGLILFRYSITFNRLGSREEEIKNRPKRFSDGIPLIEFYLYKGPKV